MGVRTDVDAVSTTTVSVSPQAIASNTTVNGSSIDTRTLAKDSRYLVWCRVGTRTDGTYTFTVQDSADNSSFATLAVFSGSLAAVSAANTSRTAAVDPVPGRPYLRVSVASTSVTTGGVVAANITSVPRIV